MKWTCEIKKGDIKITVESGNSNHGQTKFEKEEKGKKNMREPAYGSFSAELPFLKTHWRQGQCRLHGRCSK